MWRDTLPEIRTIEGCVIGWVRTNAGLLCRRLRPKRICTTTPTRSGSADTFGFLLLGVLVCEPVLHALTPSLLLFKFLGLSSKVYVSIFECRFQLGVSSV